MSAFDTALLLIDVQASFEARPCWDASALPGFLDRSNALIQGCVDTGVPIVRILHSDGPDDASNPFALSSGLVRPLDGLADFTPALTVVKRRHSALVGTDLRVWLVEHGVRRLIIAGIRTEQCCETTTRHASDEGWSVDFVTEATLTFDMISPTGEQISVHDLHTRTETVLSGRFATICTVEQALSRAAS
ncbi:cysteine hydrolase family protein [Ideonella sp.]|uniref:cysteine hydrolase family protein n=1 Tax=Ideonella sp. TaxID=1929293 RepID=UPI003BB54777